jgi:predicted nuclease of predicted toxin-antitoxin system
MALRRRGVDVVTAADIGLLGVADSEVLSRAHAASRVVVTRDKDYLRLHAAGQPHAGIVFCTHRIRRVGELVEALILIHEILSPEEMIGHVEYA